MILVKASLALVTLVAPSIVRAGVSPITRIGNKLFDATGQRFFIKGVAYQQAGTLAIDPNSGFPEPISYVDALADSTSCTRDIPNFTALGVNTVHVYNLDPKADHSACFNALNAAGLYVIADLGLPVNGSINRATPSWDTGLQDQYLTTLTNIIQYPNLLTVTVGNEVFTRPVNVIAVPFVKAAARDVKAFLKSKGSNVLVSYHSADMGVTSHDLAMYLACGGEEQSIDIFGLNNYRFCGASTFTAAGYDAQTTQFANYPVVTIFSEFGCITSPRVWTDVPLIYSTPMSDVFSGAIAFEYFADTLSYGLTNNVTSMDGPVTTNAQFTLLANQYKNATPPAETKSSATASVYPACASSAGTLAISAALPPTPDDQVCTCLSATALSCVVNPSASSAIVGSLLNTACSLLGAQGGSCDPIAGDGKTGVYGQVSGCSAQQKLDYVATMYYGKVGGAGACSFNGNATINSAAPNTAAAVNTSIAACLAQLPASGTLVPSLTSGTVVNGGGIPTATLAGSSPSASASASPSTKSGGASRGEVAWFAAVVGIVGMGVGMGLV